MCCFCLQVEKLTTVIITGFDKSAVGQFAATVRSKRPPEPYKQKGVRYVDEVVRKKEGKKGK
jgi:large subunit ribosomal protein L6